MTASTRRPGSQLATLLAVAADPSPVDGVQLYSKDAGGTKQFFVEDSAGTVYQITPVGDGSGALTFRPGSGLTGPAVFDTWSALYARLQALRALANGSGLYTIQFDPSAMALFSDMTIPAGAYDMNNVTWTGFNSGTPDVSSAPTTVFLADGSTFTGMRTFREINVAGLTTGTPHFTFSSPWLDVITLDYVDMAAAASPLFATTGGGGAAFKIENSSFGDGGNAVLTAGAGGSYANLRLGPGAILPANALETTGDGSIGLDVYGSSAYFSENQPAAPGFALGTSDYNYTYTRHYTDDNDTPGGYTQADQPVALSVGYITKFSASGADETAFSADLPAIAASDTRYKQALVRETSGQGGVLYANGTGIRITASAGETIDGAADVMLQPDQSMVLVSNGVSNWTSFKSPGAMDRRFAGVVILPAGGGEKRYAQFNVSAVAHPATGTYTVTFATPIPTGFIPNVLITVGIGIGTPLIVSYAEVDSSNITVFVQDVTGVGNDGGNRISVSVFLDPELGDV